MLFGVIGVVIVDLMGNYELVLVEIPFETGTASPAYLQFWDVPARDEPRIVNPADTSIGTWLDDWWFRASRSIRDRTVPDTFSGDLEPITEFPGFSYVHADNHAHVIAIFMAMVVIAVGFSMLLQQRNPDTLQTLFYALLLGCLLFVNMWYYPPGLVIIVGAEALRRFLRQRRLALVDWGEILVFSAVVIGVSLIAVGPYLAPLTPSVSGLLPNIYQGTRPQQMLLVLGALLPLMIVYLGVETYRLTRRRQARWYIGMVVTLDVALALIVAVVVLTYREIHRNGTDYYSIARGLIDKAPYFDVVQPAIALRLDGLPTLIILFALFLLVIVLLLPYVWRRAAPCDATDTPVGSPAAAYSFALIMVGLVLVIVPEFVYILDTWGHRGNTVFKAYIQMWFLIGIGVSYGLYSLFADPEGRIASRSRRWILGGVCCIAIAGGLPYVPAALWQRGLWDAGQYREPQTLTLEGGLSLATDDDYNVLRCLQDLVGQQDVVVASGVYGPAERYALFFDARGLSAGRVGALTGIPTVLGWGMHELSWRRVDMGVLETRYEDTRTLYTTPNLTLARTIIDRYGIDYILYGDVEHHPDWYGTAGEQKFLESFPVVCASGTSRVYKVQ